MKKLFKLFKHDIWFVALTMLLSWIFISGIVGIGTYWYYGGSLIISLVITTVYMVILGFGNTIVGYLVENSGFQQKSIKSWRSIIRVFPHMAVTAFGLPIANLLRDYILNVQLNETQTLILIQLYALSITLTVFGLGFAIFKEKQKKSTLESDLVKAELISLKAQIKPHFLFNSLNTIVALIHDNPDLAEKLTIQLSELLRYILTSSEKDKITLEEELECIKKYLTIEKERFGDRLNYEIQIDKKWLNLEVPPLILQPLIENAIKHGVSKNISSGMIKIEGKNYGEEECLIISDDGPGFPSNLLKSPLESKGHGLQNVYRRWKMVSGKEITINSSPRKGVVFYLPLGKIQNSKK